MKQRFESIKMLVIVFTTVVLSANVNAASQTETISSLSACKKIEQNDKRLACFDAVAGKMSLEANSVVTKVELKKGADDGLFGLEHKKYLSKNSASEIEVTVVKVKKNPYGYLKFTLDNSQVWIQTTTRRLKIKAGERIRIERSLLGSFKVYKLGSDVGYKVKRLK